MNTTLEEVNSRTTEAEEWIRDLEDRMVEITAAKQNVGGEMKNILKGINCRITKAEKQVSWKTERGQSLLQNTIKKKE